jgi:predicted small secreted protein
MEKVKKNLAYWKSAEQQMKEASADYAAAARFAARKVRVIERKVLKKAVVLVVLVFIALNAGCNCVNGLGRDIQTVSEPYTNQAD